MFHCFQLLKMGLKKEEIKKLGRNISPLASVAKTDWSGLWQPDNILNNPEIFPSYAKIQFTLIGTVPTECTPIPDTYYQGEAIFLFNIFISLLMCSILLVAP